MGLQTPTFSVLTSRGMPLVLRPNIVEKHLTSPILYQLPYGDLVVRQDLAKLDGENASKGCCALWPHLFGNVKYCSFRNPLKNPSVHGGDAACSVETVGGRKKVLPKDVLDLQELMRADIVGAPGEEVTYDVIASRRMQRAVARAGDWLKQILDTKAKQPSSDWHVLASIQGGRDTKLRQKACADAAALPIAGVWVGGLGYSETLFERALVLESVSSALPPALPRFLPLSSGSPIEVLQAVLLGMDVMEISYPVDAALDGTALIFQWKMPEVGGSDTKIPQGLLPIQEGDENLSIKPLPTAVLQMQLRAPEWREDFLPISDNSPVRQYSRSYIHHLLEVRELLGSMLLVEHNLFVYARFFEELRAHVTNGTLRCYASWFLETQTAEAPAPPPAGPAAKRRKT